MSAASARVVVALSGGVDSSVAAALLVEEGYQVIGMMMRLWSEGGREADNRCCTPDSMAMARRVAAQLGIPFYAIDAQQEHYRHVVRAFIDGYERGLTPNPCLICNRQVRWGFLLEQARAVGADYLATGHYARLEIQTDGLIQVRRGVDPQKDQSYVLYGLNQNLLSRTLLPIGGYTKKEVRQIARELGLPAAERSESQDLCFLAGEDYRLFLERNAPHLSRSGPIQNRLGQVLGEHRGLANYTIGQRKGLGISSGTPLYVLAKDPASSTLIVGASEDLGASWLNAVQVNWISGSPPADTIRAHVKIRYTAQPVPAAVIPSLEADPDKGFAAQVCFEAPQRDITPGQAAVFYDGDICLGGGTIQ